MRSRGTFGYDELYVPEKMWREDPEGARRAVEAVAQCAKKGALDRAGLTHKPKPKSDSLQWVEVPNRGKSGPWLTAKGKRGTYLIRKYQSSGTFHLEGLPIGFSGSWGSSGTLASCCNAAQEYDTWPPGVPERREQRELRDKLLASGLSDMG